MLNILKNAVRSKIMKLLQTNNDTAFKINLFKVY